MIGRWILGAVLAAAGVAGCGREVTRGQLMIALTSDMPIPKSVTTIAVEARQGNAVVYFVAHPLGSGKKLPGTVALVAGEDRRPLEITVSAWQETRAGHVLRIVREVTTTVPTDRIALLPIELQWLCDGNVMPVTAPEGPRQKASSRCNEGETCIAGVCQPAAIDSATLADYDPAAVFGPDGGAGGCFDVAACFAVSDQVPFVGDPKSCTIDRPQAVDKGVNVAAVVPTSGDGFCAGNRCYIPLDGFSAEGWQAQGDKVKLPAALCEKKIAVAVSGACPTKTRSLPPCPSVD